MDTTNGDQNSFFQDSILETPMTALEEKQQLLAHHVRLVARKHNHALFVFGAQGGLGKSRTILRTLDEEGVEPILINSHITPLALYTTLFRFRGEEVIFFDDVDSLYSSMPHLDRMGRYLGHQCGSARSSPRAAGRRFDHQGLLQRS